MLYDNAQILELLALAHARRPATNCSARGRAETVDWLAREMTAPGGAFCATLDADSEGVEGKFYVWTSTRSLQCSAPRTRDFRRNFTTPRRAATGSTSIIRRERHHSRTGSNLAAPDGRGGGAPRARCGGSCSTARAKRVRPGLDDKIMADWNGLMIAALVNAATLLRRAGLDRACGAGL